MNLNDLRVKRGEPIQPAWERLLKWAAGMKLISGRGVRLTVTPNGTLVAADVRSNPWDHPFKVTVSSKVAVIGNGSVNNLVPQINGAGLDGLDSNGKDVSPPQLKITGGPSKDLRSWICVQAKVDAKTGRMDAKDKNALTIIHTSTLDPKSGEGGFPDSGQGIGLQPLAMLLWSEDRAGIKRVFQITHHNLQHRFVRSGTSTAGRHFFWAA